MTKQFIWKLIPVLIGAGILALLSGTRGMGIMLVLPVLAMLIWIPYAFWVAATRPEIRALQLTRIFIWIIAVAVVVVIHSVRDQSMRRDANEMVASIKRFSTLHGRCPATLDEVGISSQQLDKKLGHSGYWCEKGKPRLYYSSSFDVTGHYFYDFESGEWAYID